MTADKIVDYYNIRFRSLHALSDYHGPNSLKTKEAKTLLGKWALYSKFNNTDCKLVMITFVAGFKFITLQSKSSPMLIPVTDYFRILYFQIDYHPTGKKVLPSNLAY